MASLRKGAFRLFRLAGIDVFLHWSWFIVAVIEINERTTAYSSIYWNIFEYLALFLIVGIHEFGHALACRQVGGTANQIILWPLGGVAYVSPPPRPGATLWSIAAGPLVNVLFLPLLSAPLLFNHYSHWLAAMPDLHAFLRAVLIINIGLLVFNMLPIYPLDGGQILRSLLWFVIGRARSLLVATVLGFVGVVGLFALALWQQSVWFGILAVFILLNCWNGLNRARALLRLAKSPSPRRFRLPLLQGFSSGRSILDLPQVQNLVRHLSDPGRLPVLFHSVPRHRLPRLRRAQPHAPVGLHSSPNRTNLLTRPPLHAIRRPAPPLAFAVAGLQPGSSRALGAQRLSSRTRFRSFRKRREGSASRPFPPASSLFVAPTSYPARECRHLYLVASGRDVSHLTS
ncbi:MAG TPA: site-2 protease family protein [Terriglobales bacterium]|nr:site-2 protease family protein [Terriglobales bacterium]